MKLRRMVLLLGVLVALPATSRGAGYSLYEQGAGSLGAAGATVARSDDASSIFFNPAGLARIRGGDLYVGTSLIYVTREFAGTAPYPGYGVVEKSPNQAFFPTTVYWGQQVGDALAVGFGFYSPYGLATEWKEPDTFSGRFLSTRTAVTPFYFNPAVAVNLTPEFRVGFGVMAVHSSVELKRHIGQANPTTIGPRVLDLGTVTLNGSNDLDFGFNLGMQLDVTDRIHLGANYRSGISAPLDGDADFTFTGTGTALDPQLAQLFPNDQKVSTEIPFPALFVLGIAVDAGETFTVEGDLGWTQWSDFASLPFRFADDPSLNQDVLENWSDTFFFRLGAEVDLDPTLALRLGYYYDDTPQSTEAVSPLLPDNIRHGISLGFGKEWGALRADLFGLLLIVPERSTDGINRDGYEGTYSSGTQIAGLSIGYRY